MQQLAGLRALGWLIGLLATGLAGAHGGGGTLALATEPLPPALDGLRVQVLDTAPAPQIVVENTSDVTFEVLDAGGRAFLRLAPDGLYADLHAAAWHRTQNAGDRPLPASASDPGAPADWVRMRAEPAWGWYDRRLDKTAVETPEHVHGDTVARWRIAVRRIGAGEPLASAISGRFDKATAQPARRARLTSSQPDWPGVHVAVQPGAEPAVSLRNTSDQPVTVLDDHGQPMLRIGPDGVHAAINSAGWQALGRHRGLAPGADGWRQVAGGDRYSWPDPRLLAALAGRNARAFSVALQRGRDSARIVGEVRRVNP